MSTRSEAGNPLRATDTWDVGEAYEAYMGRWSRFVAAPFVEWLDVPAGGVWLDVGCGTGALTAAICDVAHPVAVTGVDPSPDLVAHAADLSNADAASFVMADASSLPFEDGIFDVVVSGLVLNFLPDPLGALREQSRVVAPSGTIAAYVWDSWNGAHSSSKSRKLASASNAVVATGSSPAASNSRSRPAGLGNRTASSSATAEGMTRLATSQKWRNPLLASSSHGWPRLESRRALNHPAARA